MPWRRARETGAQIGCRRVLLAVGIGEKKAKVAKVGKSSTKLHKIATSPGCGQLYSARPPPHVAEMPWRRARATGAQVSCRWVRYGCGYWRKVGKNSKSSKSCTKLQKVAQSCKKPGVRRAVLHTATPYNQQRCSGAGRVQLEHRLAVGEYFWLRVLAKSKRK